MLPPLEPTAVASPYPLGKNTPYMPLVDLAGDALDEPEREHGYVASTSYLSRIYVASTSLTEHFKAFEQQHPRLIHNSNYVSIPAL